MRQSSLVLVVLVSSLVSALVTVALTVGLDFPTGGGQAQRANAAALIPVYSEPLLRGETASELAPVPELVNFQGVLTDAGGLPVADGSQSVTFRVYDALSAGTQEWSETQNVTTTGGLFHVLLGSATPITAAVFDGAPRYLEVQVGGDDPLAPRQQFVSIPYAFHAATANSANTAKTATSATKADLANDLDCTGYVDPADIAGSSISSGGSHIHRFEASTHDVDQAYVTIGTYYVWLDEEDTLYYSVTGRTINDANSHLRLVLNGTQQFAVPSFEVTNVTTSAAVTLTGKATGRNVVLLQVKHDHVHASDTVANDDVEVTFYKAP